MGPALIASVQKLVGVAQVQYLQMDEVARPRIIRFSASRTTLFRLLSCGPQVYDLSAKNPGAVIKAVVDCLRKIADEGDPRALECLDRLRIMVLPSQYCPFHARVTCRCHGPGGRRRWDCRVDAFKSDGCGAPSPRGRLPSRNWERFVAQLRLGVCFHPSARPRPAGRGTHRVTGRVEARRAPCLPPPTWPK